MGQSDAAWALLGTTVRLAQTMGLHTERSTIHWPAYVQGKVKTLWRAIVWQDSLLCMCYDRPPIVSVSGWPLDAEIHERLDLSYAETMHLICRLGLDIMRPGNFGFTEGDPAIEGLQKLDSICKQGQPYLQSREYCMSLQHNLEHLALRMHTSFCVSVLCRPAMKQSQPPQLFPHDDLLRARAKGSLIDASKAFLDFQALSVVPLRSWSMVHTVLSSTLLLCIWEETRHDPECRSLQQRVIDVFSSSDSRTTEDRASLPENDTQWLSARHIRALVTLRTALDREGDRMANEPQNLTGVNYDPFPPLGAGNLDSYMDVVNPFDTSPVSYLDSIMNVPLFDFTQENGFL
ncbi:Transcription factor [Penicillium angulare]|uniref:Transcription factor n=1 Tax=Penicillium angulare TaxID=116970 RepID=UPI002541AAA4|nr:Transcription factor [Penicillium angulare]KAJ5260539.1 Transcription factor [Penicillium angulare]